MLHFLWQGEIKRSEHAVVAIIIDVVVVAPVALPARGSKTFNQKTTCGTRQTIFSSMYAN